MSKAFKVGDKAIWNALDQDDKYTAYRCIITGFSDSYGRNDSRGLYTNFIITEKGEFEGLETRLHCSNSNLIHDEEKKIIVMRLVSFPKIIQVEDIEYENVY